MTEAVDSIIGSLWDGKTIAIFKNAYKQSHLAGGRVRFRGFYFSFIT
jgi:hypothetical protein